MQHVFADIVGRLEDERKLIKKGMRRFAYHKLHWRFKPLRNLLAAFEDFFWSCRVLRCRRQVNMTRRTCPSRQAPEVFLDTSISKDVSAHDLDRPMLVCCSDIFPQELHIAYQTRSKLGPRQINPFWQYNIQSPSLRAKLTLHTLISCIKISGSLSVILSTLLVHSFNAFALILNISRNLACLTASSPCHPSAYSTSPIDLTP
jgi:hypothetical protein